MNEYASMRVIICLKNANVHFALTELSYINALQTMINRYKKPLTAIVKMSLVPDSDTPPPTQYLTVQEIDTVFSNIELLLGLNKV